MVLDIILDKLIQWFITAKEIYFILKVQQKKKSFDFDNMT